MEKEEIEYDVDYYDNASIEVKKTNKRDDTQLEQMWIRKKPDADGYFLLQNKYNNINDMFLTAVDASSLHIERK